MDIREAALADCRLIHDMAWETFPNTYKNILTKEQIDYMMEWMYSVDSLKKQMTEEKHTYLLAFEGDTCAGYVSVQPQGDHTYHLQKIYVMPAFQKGGYGKQLFNAAIRWIKKVHPLPCKMELNVNRHNPALGFYEHLGMKKVSEGDYERLYYGNGDLKYFAQKE